MISHGWYFVALQLVVVVGLVPLDRWWRRRRVAAGRPLAVIVPVVETVGLALQYVVFRIQPYLRSGTFFEFSLGVFDGITLVGLALPWILHVVAPMPSSVPAIRRA